MSTFTIDVTVSNDAELLAGPWEFNPYLATHATWGKHRDEALCDLPPSDATTHERKVTLGPYAWPDKDTLRGDENIWMVQWVNSHKSGIAAIDAKEAGNI